VHSLSVSAIDLGTTTEVVARTGFQVRRPRSTDNRPLFRCQGALRVRRGRRRLWAHCSRGRVGADLCPACTSGQAREPFRAKGQPTGSGAGRQPNTSRCWRRFPARKSTQRPSIHSAGPIVRSTSSTCCSLT